MKRKLVLLTSCSELHSACLQAGPTQGPWPPGFPPGVHRPLGCFFFFCLAFRASAGLLGSWLLGFSPYNRTAMSVCTPAQPAARLLHWPHTDGAAIPARANPTLHLHRQNTRNCHTTRQPRSSLLHRATYPQFRGFCWPLAAGQRGQPGMGFLFSWCKRTNAADPKAGTIDGQPATPTAVVLQTGDLSSGMADQRGLGGLYDLRHGGALPPGKCVYVQSGDTSDFDGAGIRPCVGRTYMLVSAAHFRVCVYRPHERPQRSQRTAVGCTSNAHRLLHSSSRTSRTTPNGRL